MSGLSIAKSLELQLLRPLVSALELERSCELAAVRHLASVTVWPGHVARASRVLTAADIRVCAAIGYPFGTDLLAIRLAAAESALEQGADELVIAASHSSMLDGDFSALRRELEQIVSHAFWSSLTSSRGRGEPALALETMAIGRGSMEELATALADLPVGFLHTGSGELPHLVTNDHVRRLRERLPPEVAITAVGGVASIDDATGLIAAGASRVASGSAIAIHEQESRARRVRQPNNL